jgi:hypothetical protein
MRDLNGPRRLSSVRALPSGGWWQTPFEYLFSIAAQFCSGKRIHESFPTIWRAVFYDALLGTARGTVPANTPKHVERQPIEGC